MSHENKQWRPFCVYTRVRNTAAYNQRPARIEVQILPLKTRVKGVRSNPSLSVSDILIRFKYLKVHRATLVCPEKCSKTCLTPTRWVRFVGHRFSRRKSRRRNRQAVDQHEYWNGVEHQPTGTKQRTIFAGLRVAQAYCTGQVFDMSVIKQAHQFVSTNYYYYSAIGRQRNITHRLGGWRPNDYIYNMSNTI